jgi:hypothetical protein
MEKFVKTLVALCTVATLFVLASCQQNDVNPDGSANRNARTAADTCSRS